MAFKTQPRCQDVPVCPRVTEETVAGTVGHPGVSKSQGLFCHRDKQMLSCGKARSSLRLARPPPPAPGVAPTAPHCSSRFSLTLDFNTLALVQSGNVSLKEHRRTNKNAQIRVFGI